MSARRRSAARVSEPRAGHSGAEAAQTPDRETPDPEERPLGIREMCAAFDVTPRTLRFYEQKGLIAPERRGQHRLYSRRERARLTLILRGRRFGFALDQIGELLDLYDRDDRELVQLRRTYAIACDRLADMERQRAELDEAITELRAELARGAEALARAGLTDPATASRSLRAAPSERGAPGAVPGAVPAAAPEAAAQSATPRTAHPRPAPSRR